MTLVSGALLGPYQIEAPLGAGGMGEVYRARDTRLNRDVALKVLPPHARDDPEFQRRFTREAQAVAALSHPQICAIHDIGEQDGTGYLVMELLDGETLEQRLARGALPLAEALRYALQIADALGAAHRTGVVHRDLKPANIMLTRTGAKVLDFGLAKLTPPSGPIEGVTRTTPLTGYGTILGTLQYMAPEQLEGQEADARSDIFAFGSVLFEMVTGRKAFAGRSQASLIGAIIKDEPPPVSTTTGDAPPALDRVIATCLAKNPDERWQSAQDLKLPLQWISEGTLTSGAQIRRRVARATWILAAVIGLFAGAAAASIAWWRASAVRPAGDPPPVHFSVEVPLRALGVAPTISADGTRLVYRAGRHLYLRSMNDPQPRQIAGTEYASDPFFSPDGQWVGFHARRKLMKVFLGGGAPLAICDLAQPFGASWASDDSIYLGSTRGILRVAASGGVPTVAVPLRSGDTDYSRPHVLPGGKAVVFVNVKRSADGDTDPEIVAQSLTGDRRTVVARSGRDPQYLASGHIIYASREGPLLAMPFDLAALSPTGGAVPVLDRVAPFLGAGSAFSVSPTGTLVYIPSHAADVYDVRLRDERGSVRTVTTVRARHVHLRVSPARSQIAMISAGRDGAVWVVDVARGTMRRLSTQARPYETPVWDPDGRRLMYARYLPARGGTELMLRSPDGATPERRVHTIAGHAHLGSIAPDGRTLVFSRESDERRAEGYTEDIYVLSLADNVERPFVRSRFHEQQPRISPDGRWLAYSSDETGRDEIYLEPFPAGGDRRRVSADGGITPRWIRGGRELLFLAESRLVAVSVGGDGQIGAPRDVAEAPVSDFDVGDGGEVVTLDRVSPPPPIHVILNWSTDVKRRAVRH